MASPAGPGADVTALFASLSRVSRQADRYLGEVLSELGLQGWEYDVLTTLLRSGEPHELRPGTIADRLGVSNSAMTNRIDRLEQAGLVGRHLDPRNRRIVIVRLTNAGRDSAERALAAHCAAARRVLDRLSADRAAALRDLLDQLGSALA
ncbi:MarR family winged helix-turn-helix transcriptional regulator [Saccharopolyspora rosea]|uniref:MarR family winged helix-turn-helix transcriptional regulator n=1 Tax=Saccharopolyspora rosea TaxID=524884 RepID=A0ABW3FX78_9PSEU|nr:MarR family transcriptional regulator [Saccharopolyspora rosea]